VHQNCKTHYGAALTIFAINTQHAFTPRAPRLLAAAICLRLSHLHGKMSGQFSHTILPPPRCDVTLRPRVVCRRRPSCHPSSQAPLSSKRHHCTNKVGQGSSLIAFNSENFTAISVNPLQMFWEMCKSRGMRGE
jgi:hypothetical protein